jgi:hypothetical protein
METDDYVAVFDALEAAEKKGLGEHKVAVEAQNKLALYMKQMEASDSAALILPPTLGLGGAERLTRWT